MKNSLVDYIKDFHKSKRKKMSIRLKNSEPFKQESHPQQKISQCSMSIWKDVRH